MTETMELAVVSYRREVLDVWLMTSPLGTPRERCDEYSIKIFPQLRNQDMSIRRRTDNTTEGDADWLNNTPTRAPFNDTC
jgi:hypothetical protein